MVSQAMRRYKLRSPSEAALVGPPGDGLIDAQALFGRRARLRVDLGSGHGEFVTAMAAHHPEEDFLAVERQVVRVTKTARACLRLGLGNVRLFEDEIHAFVRLRLPPASVHRLYVLYPDPWPKPGHRRRRLLNRAFLLDAAWALSPGGRLVFVSDVPNYSCAVLANATLLPGLWRNLGEPAGYWVDPPHRFPTVFERHRRNAGCRPLHLEWERTSAVAPPRLAALWVDRPGFRQAPQGGQGPDQGVEQLAVPEDGEIESDR